MFAATTSIVPTRVALSRRPARARPRRSGAVAYTEWMLDGVGCSGARSDDANLVRRVDAVRASGASLLHLLRLRGSYARQRVLVQVVSRPRELSR